MSRATRAKWDAELARINAGIAEREAESYRTTLAILSGDGEEYTDTVRITFTRDWDETLTRTHTVSWETFTRALALIEQSEKEVYA